MAPKPLRISRRKFLGDALSLTASGLLVACGGGENLELFEPLPAGDSNDGEPSSTPPPVVSSKTQVGPAANAPATLDVDPLIWVVPKRMRQGSAFVVAVDAPGAGFASVAFNGQVFTLLREGSRFFTILGLDALLPIGPMPVVLRVSDASGRPVVQRETLITVEDGLWRTEVVELDESNQELLDPNVIEEDFNVRNRIYVHETPERHWDGGFDPPSNGVITSNYGLLRSYNFQPVTEYHSGLDFAGENGDPVLAPNAGVVAWTGQTRRRGNGLLIDHGGGIFSGYYHLSEVLVATGAVVTTGDFVGRIGATGLATGPHLHWEIVTHGVTVDPVQWIRDLEYPNPLAKFDPSTAVQSPNQIVN